MQNFTKEETEYEWKDKDSWCVTFVANCLLAGENDGRKMRDMLSLVKELRTRISDDAEKAYKKGTQDCCVSKLGCLCKPSSMKCDMDTCPCPEHYGTHDEWLREITRKK